MIYVARHRPTGSLKIGCSKEPEARIARLARVRREAVQKYLKDRGG